MCPRGMWESDSERAKVFQIQYDTLAVTVIYSLKEFLANTRSELLEPNGAWTEPVATMMTGVYCITFCFWLN